ncbi:MAG: cytidylate kinase-like family protein [Pseudomonadota bacterium]
MSVITISRGSFSMGKEVAEKVAKRLNFECFSRDILLEASDYFNIPEIKLEHAIKDAPSVLERFTHGRARYIAYVRSALTRRLCKDNAVYHGLAGHILLKNVTHVLKVRIIADLDLRTSVVMNREKLSKREAIDWVNKLDRERRKWTKSLYGVDPWDPSLYDLLLNIPRFEVNDAVELICEAVKKKQFATTAASQQQMEDLAIASQVKAALIEKHPNAFVASTYGNVLVYCAAGDRSARRIKSDVSEICSKIKGVNNIEIHAGVNPPASAV